MSHTVPYRSVTEYPDRVDGPAVLARLLDGVGHRLYWATEGLTDADYAYKPCEGANTIGGILRHVWGLVNWMCEHILDGSYKAHRPGTFTEQRDAALVLCKKLRDHVISLSDDELSRIVIQDHPFWHMINGPVADALTHIGQISYLRRAAGNPNPGKASVFSMAEPTE